VAGFANSNFFTGPEGEMVFSCPVTGGTTRGSDFPRSELRELLVPASENFNWNGYGSHALNAQCKVLQLPSSKKIIIGQIHSFTGASLPLVKLQYNNGTVQALVKESPIATEDTVFPLATVGLNSFISYQIKMVDGQLSMTANGATQSVNVFQTDSAWTNQTFYFKAGCYCQDNVGDPNEAGIVSFYQLKVEHGNALSPSAAHKDPANHPHGGLKDSSATAGPQVFPPRRSPTRGGYGFQSTIPQSGAIP
jgi:hypothetical protein